MQVGQTLDGMRVWDIQRAIKALRQIDGLEMAPLTIEAEGKMAVNALHASLCETMVNNLLQSPHFPSERS